MTTSSEISGNENEALKELKWLKMAQTLESPFPENNLKKKIIENPFVPLGVLATTGALFCGLNAMRKKDKKKQQLMMRYRIGFQAFTLLAGVIGLLFFQGNKKANKKI